MTCVIGGAVTFALLLVVTGLVTQVMLISWDTQTGVQKASLRQQEERLAASVGIQSTTGTSTDCLSYTASVTNSGETLVADFTDMDVLVQFMDGADAQTVSRLGYTTDWTISMSPDDLDPNAWNPGETATISFTLGSAPKSNTRGTVVVVTPQGVLDSTYFRCLCATSDTGFKTPAPKPRIPGATTTGMSLTPPAPFPTMPPSLPTSAATVTGTSFTTTVSPSRAVAVSVGWRCGWIGG